LTKLNIESSKSFNCQTKNTILSSNENNRNQPEKPSKRAYLFEKNGTTCINFNFKQIKIIVTKFVLRFT